MAKNKITIIWDSGCRERKSPSVNETNIGTLLPDNTVHYSDLDVVPDRDDPTNPDKRWILLQSGWYIAVKYPSFGGEVVRAIVEPMFPAPVGFQWPDRFEAQYLDAAGNVVANKFYIPE